MDVGFPWKSLVAAAFFAALSVAVMINHAGYLARLKASEADAVASLQVARESILFLSAELNAERKKPAPKPVIVPCRAAERPSVTPAFERGRMFD